MSDHIDNVITNLAKSIETPDVDNIYELASTRKQQRTRRSVIGGLVILVGLLAIGRLLVDPPEPTDLATLGEPTTPTTASTPTSTTPTTTTTVEVADDGRDEARCLDLLKESDAQLEENREEKLRLCAQVAAHRDGQAFSEQLFSPQQQAALEDGLLEAEYEAAFRRFQACTAAAGVELELTQTLKTDGIFGYRFADAEGRLFLHDVCYTWHYVRIDAQWQTAHEHVRSQPGQVYEQECSGAGLCSTGFELNGLVYGVSCAAVSEDAVLETVIGHGHAFDQIVEVHPIDGYVPSQIVAINLPGGFCGDNNAAQRTSPWSVAFTSSTEEALAALCEHGLLTPEQSAANGCT